PDPDRDKPGHEEPDPRAAGPARTPAPPSGPAPSEPAPPPKPAPSGQNALPRRSSPRGPLPPPATDTPTLASADLSPPPGGEGSGPSSQSDETLPKVRVSGPADIRAVVPPLIGFHPELSFVVIGASGPRRRVELGFRYDLPDPPGAAAAAEIADHAVAVLAQRGASTVIGIGYGPGRL